VVPLPAPAGQRMAAGISFDLYRCRISELS